MDPDQTAPIGTVCSGSTLFASIRNLNKSVMLGNYLQQMSFFRCIFFLGALRVNRESPSEHSCQIVCISRDFLVFSGAEIWPHSQWNLGDFFPILKKKKNLPKKSFFS